MKINNTTSFKGILVKKGPFSDNQRVILGNAIKAIMDENSYYNNVLEHLGTDVLFSSNPDGRSVDVKILSGAGFNYSYTPEDEKGEIKYNFHVPERRFEPSQRRRLYNNIRLNMNKFMYRAICCVTQELSSPVNVKKFNKLEDISIKDMMEYNRISRPDLIPDATCVYGEQQITTK